MSDHEINAMRRHALQDAVLARLEWTMHGTREILFDEPIAVEGGDELWFHIDGQTVRATCAYDGEIIGVATTIPELTLDNMYQ